MASGLLPPLQRFWSGIKRAPASVGAYITQISAVPDLKSEIELLTSYSSDTIYRLRYDTMRYDYISPSVQRLLGYTPEEMHEMNIRSLILETRIVNDTLKPVESFGALEETRKRGEVNKWQADYLICTKDGREVWISDVSFPWYDDKGAIVGSVGSLRDISDRVEAEARARTEIQRMASTDILTNLANRHRFFTRLEDELKRIKRNRDDLAIMLIDIDHFKKINAEHGYYIGDTVIKGVAGIIASCLRETDTGARIGGEEFGVILPETPAAGAFWVAERIRAGIEKHDFPSESTRPIHCTVSIGIASARFDEHADAVTLYKSADTRLYIAKSTGRNQVSMDELMELH